MGDKIDNDFEERIRERAFELWTGEDSQEEKKSIGNVLGRKLRGSLLRTLPSGHEGIQQDFRRHSSGAPARVWLEG